MTVDNWHKMHIGRQKTYTEIKDTLREFGYRTNLVAAEIYGKPRYLNEYEVRALQVIAKRKAEISDEAFKEFTDNVIIYSGRYKRKSTHIMHFRKDGIFSDEFDSGFYDTSAKLAFELF